MVEKAEINSILFEKIKRSFQIFWGISLISWELILIL